MRSMKQSKRSHFIRRDSFKSWLEGCWVLRSLQMQVWDWRGKDWEGNICLAVPIAAVKLCQISWNCTFLQHKHKWSDQSWEVLHRLQFTHVLAKNDATTPCWFFIIGCTCWANITPHRADTFPLHKHTFPMCNNIEEFKIFLKCPSWCVLWLQYVASSVLWKKLGNLPGSSASALFNTIKLWTTSVLETPVHISPRTMIYSLGWMETSVLSWFYQPVVNAWRTHSSHPYWWWPKHYQLFDSQLVLVWAAIWWNSGIRSPVFSFNPTSIRPPCMYDQHLEIQPPSRDKHLMNNMA